MEQRCQGTLQVWAEQIVTLRIPKFHNLRLDPYERADVTSNSYRDWYVDHAYLILAAQSVIVRFLETFKEILTAAQRFGWTVASMRADWKRLFADVRPGGDPVATPPG